MVSLLCHVVSRKIHSGIKLFRRTTWHILVDLAVGELVDLVVVLVTKTCTVGSVVDFYVTC